MIQQQGMRKKEYAFLCCFRSTKLKHLEATVKTTITHWKLSTLSRKLFPVCKTTCRHTDDGVFDDFPKISDHFPKIYKDFSKLFRKPDERSRTFSEDYRRLPKTIEEDPNMFRSCMYQRNTSISSLVRIWKIRHPCPGCSFVWILRVVSLTVKHSCLKKSS